MTVANKIKTEKIGWGFFWLFGWSLIFLVFTRNFNYVLFMWGVCSPIMIPFGSFMAFWYFPKYVNNKYKKNDEKKEESQFFDKVS